MIQMQGQSEVSDTELLETEDSELLTTEAQVFVAEE